MHFDVAIDTCALLTLLTVHDAIFSETLLTRMATWRAAALKFIVGLSCLKGELKVSIEHGIRRCTLNSLDYSYSPGKGLLVRICLNVTILKELLTVRRRAANAIPPLIVKLRRNRIR